VGFVAAVLLGTSPGMWVAGVAFLPSSEAALLGCLVWAAWMSERFELGIFLGSAAVIAVWPFTGLLFVPLGLHSLVTVGPVRALLCALSSFAFWATLSLVVDSYFYGRLVLPAAEIIRYNVLSSNSSGGSELYGTEPWYFYLLNGFLNLTMALPAAFALLPSVAVLATLERWSGVKAPPSIAQAFSSRLGWKAIAFSAAGFCWLAFFSCIPHKEERFLVPSYPALALAAAAATSTVSSVVARATFPSLGRLTSILLTTGTILLSISRIVTLQLGYGAPLYIYNTLSEELSTLRRSLPDAQGDLDICIGGEWHRFASSFFLPSTEDHLRYVRHGSVGLLPAEWDPKLGTSGVPLAMNNQNKEEPSRYIHPHACEYFLDLDIGAGEDDVKSLRSTAFEASWAVVADAAFLDASQSRQPWRSFYIPLVSTPKNVYARYRLWRCRWPASSFAE